MHKSLIYFVAFFAILPNSPSMSLAAAGSADMPDNWQQLSISELNGIVEAVNFRYPNSPYLERRRAVELPIWNKYLANDQLLQEAIAADRLETIKLVKNMIFDLPLDCACSIRDRLKGFTAKPGFLGSLTFEEFKNLYDVFDYIKASRGALQAMTLQWVVASDQWRALPPLDLIDLAELLAADSLPATQQARQAITIKAWHDFLGEPSFVAAADTTTLYRSILAFDPGFDSQQAAAIRQRLDQRFRDNHGQLENLPVQKFGQLYVAFRAIDASDDQLARLVASWAEARDARALYAIDDQWNPFIQFHDFSTLLRGSSNPSTYASEIRELLLSDKKSLGPAAGRLLAFAAVVGGDPRAWQQALQQRATDAAKAGANPDLQAGFLLAMANAVAVANSEQEFPQSRLYAEHALEIVQSDNLRLAITQWLSLRLAAHGDPAGAESSIQTAINKSADPKVIHQLYTLSTQAGLWFQILDHEHSHSHDAAVKRLHGQLAYLEDRVSQARSSHRPADDIRSLEVMIQNTQQQLQKLTADVSSSTNKS